MQTKINPLFMISIIYFFKDMIIFINSTYIKSLYMAEKKPPKKR